MLQAKYHAIWRSNYHIISSYHITSYAHIISHIIISYPIISYHIIWSYRIIPLCTHISLCIMTLTSLDIRVIMACDKIQLGPIDYVVTHIRSVAHGNMSKIRLEKLFSCWRTDLPTNRTINWWKGWFILLHIISHVYLPTFIKNS